jgi:Protein of unknown function (DUF3108)
MARWLTPLALALLLALAVHGVVLWWVGQEMQASASAMARHADPLFTRQITQPIAPATVGVQILEKKQAAAQQNLAQAATKNVAKSFQPKVPLDDATPAQASAAATPTDSTPTVATLSTVPWVASPNDTALATSPADTVAQSMLTPEMAAATAAARMASAQAHAQAAALALQGEWPADTRLTYQLSGYFRGDLHGDAQVQWTRPSAALSADTAQATVATNSTVPSERYQVRINIAIGFVKAQLQSQGRVRSTGLQPSAYEEQLPSGGRRSVTLNAREVQLADGRRLARPGDDLALVQDTASQFVDLGHRFSTGRAVLKEGEVLRVWLARPGGMDEWTYDVGPAETIYLPTLGPVQAYHLRPRPLAAARGSITAEMWFAPSLQYLPVRIKISLSQDAHLDLLVQKIEQR